MNHSVQIVKDYLQTLQNQICSALEQEEPTARFRVDEWTYPTGGGGCTQVLEGGCALEKAGVNFSHVSGQNLPSSATAIRPALVGADFEAVGVSLVLHPQNPFVPTTHLNLRYFLTTKLRQGAIPKAIEFSARRREIEHAQCTKKYMSVRDERQQSRKLNCEGYSWWFGGGFDLTPTYGFEEDCRHWHITAKKACDPFGSDVYSRFKKWCDEYFYLKHREEPRGIGGIFFDDLNEWPWEQCFEFIKSVGGAFLEGYLPILQKRKNMPFEARHRAFQKVRRGRYVEFNLIYDRGTLFGLQSRGRTESILMSLPPEVAWNYDYKPQPGSQEQELLEIFLKPKDWVK